jgi:type IV pilus assembly protein PilB
VKLRQRAEPRAVDQAATGGERAAPGENARGGEWAPRGGHGADGSGQAAPDEPRAGTAPLELRLGDFLIARGMVTSVQVDEALQLQKGTGIRLGEMLVNMGFVGERGLIEALADRLHMPVSDLRSENPDPAALALIPEAVARETLAVPVSLTGDVLRVAVAEPTPEVHRILTQTSGRVVELMLSPLSDIRRTIDSSYRALGGVDKLVEAFQAVETLRKRASDMEDLEVVGNEAPVVQIVNRILTQALRDRASDVHIESQDDVVRVRYRIDGALKDELSLPASMGLGLISRIKIMAGMNIVERRRPQDGQFSTTIDARQIDVRVATVATLWGENCVMRILDKVRSVFRFGDLGMPADTADTFSKMTHSPFGMVLCAGPTGSGKTTSLYATLSALNEPSRNLMTIEDPVEYVFPSINQIQTNDQAGLTFATGLKSILRQDPDIILVGEIRDVETARIAVQAALTGHLVLSSLHATDSASALYRFLDMGIEPFVIAASVIGIMGQRLIRRTCPSCKAPYTPNDEELEYYRANDGPPKDTFYRGQGCNFCTDTGYQGRIGVYELLQVTPEIKRLIVSSSDHDAIRVMARQEGMRTLGQEAMTLIVNDVTTLAEVIRTIHSL